MQRLIDLSHTLLPGLPSFPGDPVLSIEAHSSIPPAEWRVLRISMGSHQGTHVDAPAHCFADGRGIDELPLDRFFGAATLIDLAPGGALPPHTPLTIKTFAPHAKHFVNNARIIYRTGWDRRFGQPDFFTDYPTLTLDAARWIASRRIALLGMDTPTPSNDALECHQILLAPDKEIVILEGTRSSGRAAAALHLQRLSAKTGTRRRSTRPRRRHRR
jgi:kynurenine formamidase